MKKAAVVIPYYHNDLSVTEQISLMQCCLVLNKYDIILVAPESLEIHTDREFIVKRVPDKWLADIEGYNQLMAQKFFYEMFLGYEYILIYQLDAYVFCDELLRFCNMGYDYIGAPWLRGTKFFHGNEALIFVGNGGFSLRKVQTFYSLALEEHETINIPEDVFWSEHISVEFLVPDVDIALQFAFEEQVRKCYELNGNRMPFGIHAWMNFDFTFVKEWMTGYKAMLEQVSGRNWDLERDYEYNRHLFYSKEQIEQMPFGIIQKQFQQLIVFGAGDLGRDCIWLLKRSGYYPIVCMDTYKAGSSVDDIVIEEPQKILEYDNNIGIIVATKREIALEIIKQLKRMQCRIENIFILEELFAEEK